MCICVCIIDVYTCVYVCAVLYHVLLVLCVPYMLYH